MPKPCHSHNRSRSESGSALLWVLTMSLVVSILVMILGTLVSNQQKLVRYVHDRSIYEAEVERAAHEVIAVLGPRLGRDGIVTSWGPPNGTNHVFHLKAESKAIARMYANSEGEANPELGLIHADAHQLDTGTLYLNTATGRKYAVRFDPSWAKVIAMRQLEHDATPSPAALEIISSSRAGSEYRLVLRSDAAGYVYPIVDHPASDLPSNVFVLPARAQRIDPGSNELIFMDPHPSLSDKRLRLLFSAELQQPDGHLRWNENGEQKGVSSVTHATLHDSGATQLDLIATP